MRRSIGSRSAPSIAAHRCGWARGVESGSSSLLAPKEHLDVYRGINFDRSVSVDVTTLALWAQRNCIERIDGLWLDMQGHELTALMAAGEVLATTRAIILEVFAVELYEGAPLWPEVRDWLEAAGFRVKAESWHETGADGDVLAIRTRR